MKIFMICHILEVIDNTFQFLKSYFSISFVFFVRLFEDHKFNERELFDMNLVRYNA